MKKKGKAKLDKKETKIDIVNICLMGLLVIVVVLFLIACDVPVQHNAILINESVNFTMDCNCSPFKADLRGFLSHYYNYHCYNSNTSLDALIELSQLYNRTNITFSNECINLTIWNKNSSYQNDS